MKIGGLSDFNYCWHVGGGQDGGGSPGGGRREGPGHSPGRVQGRNAGRRFGGRAPQLPRNELKMFHERILSKNEAWFVKIRKQMSTEKKDDFVRLCI